MTSTKNARFRENDWGFRASSYIIDRDFFDTWYNSASLSISTTTGAYMYYSGKLEKSKVENDYGEKKITNIWENWIVNV